MQSMNEWQRMNEWRSMNKWQSMNEWRSVKVCMAECEGMTEYECMK